MKSRSSLSTILTTLLALLVTTLEMSAQELTQQVDKNHRQYQLIDLGTLGGPNSYLPLLSLSKNGTFAGSADTMTPDPYGPSFCNNNDCFVSHAITWRNGTLTDLGVLPGPPGSSSTATWISKNGVIAGFSLNGQIDPLFGAPEIRAVLWQNDVIADLGTLEGGYESGAFAVNNSGQVVGFATNLVPDPNSIAGITTQSRAFLWEDGLMQDLGTLPGGTDAIALFVNERGQIVGQSYTADSIVPPPIGCGDSPLTLYTFSWEKGVMTDIGTLGGHCATPYSLNSRGEVVGQSNVAEDATSHPFLWQPGRKMKDLGTVGGTYGYAAWLNDFGAVVGATTIEGDQALLAFFWEKGTMTNLGALPGNACSAADAINSAGQIVGGSGFDAPSFPACTDPVEHAVLWENGQILDLNAFVPPGSDLTLSEATFINDRGEISGIGTLSNGDQHPFLLIPCGENHANTEGCEGASDTNATQGTPAPTAPATTASQPNLTSRGMMTFGSRTRLGRGYRSPAVVTLAAPHNLSASAQNTYQTKLNWQEASGQNQSGFDIYRCHGCSSPRTQGTKVASVGASVFAYTNGSSSHPLTESTNYTYQVTAFNGGGESGPSSAASATTKTEPAPTRLTSIAQFRRAAEIFLNWTNNSTDDDSYHIERCTGSTCTNFSEIASIGANATAYTDFYKYSFVTLRYRVRTHSPGGYSGYSNISSAYVP